MLVIKQFGPVTYAMGTLQEILAGTGIAAKVRALPNDVAGCTLEMGADGLWTGNLGTLTQAQADALVAAGVIGNVKKGTKATISTTEVTWTGSAWDNRVYDTWELAAAAGSTLGWVGWVRRLGGVGYFMVMHNGVRLAVVPGHSPICDTGVNSAGYDLTATGTAYVPLVSYKIPADMIGDGEEWEVSGRWRNSGVFAAGATIPDIRIAGQSIKGSPATINAANQVCRTRGAFVRLGSILEYHSGASATADLYSSIASTDRSVDMSVSQLLDAGFVPSTVGDTQRLRYICLRRIG